VNLAVSNICNASCLFCPRSFVTVEKDKRFMSVSLVERIMEEVTKPEFKAQHPVVHAACAENGEPFLNPDILDILRTVRAHGLEVTLFSNFSLITEKIALVIITENLTGSIHFNIDGVTPESYKAVKGLDLKTVENNIKRFIEIRDSMKSPIKLLGHIITQATYYNAVMKEYVRPPAKFKEPLHPEDRELTLLKVKSILNPLSDTVGIDSVLFWAERYSGYPRSGPFRCPNLERVKHVAYINPEGDAYACCFDVGNELVIGNVNEDSLYEIAKSNRRKDLVKKLEEGRFEEIGFPCTRVDCCQGVRV